MDEREALTLQEKILTLFEELELGDYYLISVLDINAEDLIRLRHDQTSLVLPEESRPKAVRLVRVYDKLMSIIGTTDHAAQWIHNYNCFLFCAPVELLSSPTGLQKLSDYLEARMVPLPG